MPVRIQTWNLVFLAGLIAFTAIRGVYARRTRHIERTVSHMGPLEGVLLAIVAVGALLLPILYLATPWLAFADYDLPAWAPWCGTAVMIAGLWLFWRSHADLGHNWSVTLELRREHELVTHGVYRRVRHPMYAAIWLFSIGQGLMLSNWLAGWAAVAAFLPMFIIRLPREERMMIECFGDSYRAYARRTGRVIPRIGVDREHPRSRDA